MGLIELVTVIALMGIVMAAVVGLYISGVRAQANITARFNAETELHVGLDRMRKDIHSACSETAQSATSITLAEPSTCNSTSLITWCTRGSGSAYGLYRIKGAAATCTGGQKLGDYLTSGSIFTYTGPDSPANSWSLARLHLDITVNSTPAKSSLNYHVVDDVAFGNSGRCVVGSTC